ncbi:hypothetical protein Bhyg_12149 [Pseudolycoriella hygida]|uniref:Uncharacterized protein n=1 Tax=Pseudolycoriella hygida TaxID=35572 RepID=A0A9Q0RZ09_9DIPT|nr:hypothetical protein Bhyg_12149 [Pseudolycoriella hygida]
MKRKVDVLNIDYIETYVIIETVEDGNIYVQFVPYVWLIALKKNVAIKPRDSRAKFVFMLPTKNDQQWELRHGRVLKMRLASIEDALHSEKLFSDYFSTTEAEATAVTIQSTKPKNVKRNKKAPVKTFERDESSSKSDAECQAADDDFIPNMPNLYIFNLIKTNDENMNIAAAHTPSGANNGVLKNISFNGPDNNFMERMTVNANMDAPFDQRRNNDQSANAFGLYDVKSTSKRRAADCGARRKKKENELDLTDEEIDEFNAKFKRVFPVSTSDALFYFNETDDEKFKPFVAFKLEKLKGCDETKTARKLLKSLCHADCMSHIRGSFVVNMIVGIIEKKFPKCDATEVLKGVVQQRTKSASEKFDKMNSQSTAAKLSQSIQSSSQETLPSPSTELSQATILEESFSSAGSLLVNLLDTVNNVGEQNQGQE